IATARAWSRREASWVYASNTFGSISGALLTAAVVIPRVGLHGTFLLSMWLLAATGVVLVVVSARRAKALAAATILALVGAAVSQRTSRWNVELLSSGAYKYSAYAGDQDLEPRLIAGIVNYYREGATGTVAVRELAGVRALSIDGKVDASNGGDMITQRLLAHVPLLARPGAERVAIIGLGSGVTTGSALTYPIRQVDVIEISPEVIEASAWFEGENHRALEDKRVRLIRGDARTHFRLSRTRYDAIISEPSNPWMAGVAALFTREFFESLRDHLTPGGVVCQWAHTYDIAADDLRSIVGTFSRVFPHVSMFLIGSGDLLLLGSETSLAVSLDHQPPRDEARRDLQAAGVTTLQVLEQFRLGDAGSISSWTGSPRFQSDDRMALEFSVPAATVGASREDNASALLRTTERPPASDPTVTRDAGLLALRAEAPDRAWALLSSVVSRLRADRTTLEGLARAAAMSADRTRLATLESLLRDTIAVEPNALAPRLQLARMLAARGEYDQARRVTEGAEQLAARDVEVQEELAAIAADAGDAAGLERALLRLRQFPSAASSTSYFEAVLCMITGHPDAAIPFARSAVAANPHHAAAWNLLGSALGSTGAPADEIRHAFNRAIRADPSDPAAYANLGTLELSSGRAALAANWFAPALTIDATHDAARKGLAAASGR
ncbi:MAG: tetratricopeptide repeat protein, partial [Acidobacteriota bacterium]